MRSLYSRVVPLHHVQHPVANDALAILRDARTSHAAFRQAARRVSLIVVAEALRLAPTLPVTVQTPLAPAHCARIHPDIVVVPVLRAGLSMVEAVLDLVPTARVGHIGLQRDEDTAVASRYYARIPGGLSDALTLITDPMLATGGSAIAAIDLLRGAGAERIALVCAVAAPEGIAAVQRHDPTVDIITPAIDERLNDRQYIVPGLGDFGDRLYGTL